MCRNNTKAKKKTASIFRCSVSRKKQKETVYPIPIPCQNSYFSFLQSKVLDQSLNSKAHWHLFKLHFILFRHNLVCPVVCFVQEQYFVRRRSEGKILREVALSAPLPGLLAHNRESRQKEKSPFSAQTFSPQSQTSLLAETQFLNSYSHWNERSIVELEF